MKKSHKLLSLTLALAFVFIMALSACGASESDSAAAPGNDSSSVDNDDYSYDIATTYGLSTSTSQGEDSSEVLVESTDKIIYTGSATIETQDFDQTIEDLETLISNSGGYVQSSYVQDGSLYGSNSGYRSASYVVCIPVDSFKSVMNGLPELGNVPYSSMNEDNITTVYTDAQARLTARQAEETRLLELLAEANSVDDMLSIEDHLSDVRYEIESLTAQIRNWDTEISYSTLTLSISEVSIYSDGTSETGSYGSQLISALGNSAKHVWHFLKNLFKWIVAALPVLAVIAVIGIPVFFLVRCIVRRRRAKKAADGAGETKE